LVDRRRYIVVSVSVGLYTLWRIQKLGLTSSLYTMLKSKLIDLLSTNYSFDYIRDCFRSVNLATRPTLKPGHSHGNAAGYRMMANNAITSLLQHCGLKNYVVSPGQRDFQQHMIGDRVYYLAKDLQYPATINEIPKGDFAIRMIDVDYYVDMPKLLREKRPVMMYTFAPMEPAGSVPDGVYTCSDDKVRVKINGGAEYEHQLWDYDHDHLTIPGFFKDTVYLCEHRSIQGDEQHKIVVLVPVRSYWNLFGLLRLPGPTLERRKFSRGPYNKMSFIRREGNQYESFLSFSPANIVSVCTLPEQLVYNIYQRVKRSKDSILASVEGSLRTYYGGNTVNFKWPQWKQNGDPATCATILVDIIENYPEILDLNVNKQTLTALSAAHYTVPSDQHTLDVGKETFRALVSIDQSYFPGAVGPTSCISNDVACVTERIVKVKNNVKEVPQRYYGYATDFMEMLITEENHHVGHPVDIDEVYNRQNRPSQKRILDRVVNFLYDDKPKTVSSFQKREIYGKYTAPRNISTIEGRRKVRYSQFTYAIGPQFYKHDFYAFAKTPQELELRMEAFLQKAKFVLPTDFSKFDGTHSEWLAKMEVQCAKRYFAQEYHAELTELMMSEYNCKGFTRFGHPYDTWWSRLSGSPGTSIWNTFDSALVAFITFRECGATKEEAYQNLGIYGGDDGVSSNVSAQTYENVCEKIGLKIKLQVVKPDEPVPFLGREFCGSWSTPGGIWSMADIKRQAMKLHLTVSSDDVPDWVVLLRKATGFSLTDSETPLIGAWSKAVMRYCDAHGVRLGGYESEKLFERFPADKQFRSCPDGLKYFHADQNTGLFAETIIAEEQRLELLGDDFEIADLFKRLANAEPPKPDLPVVAGAFLIEPEPKQPAPEAVANPPDQGVVRGGNVEPEKGGEKVVDVLKPNARVPGEKDQRPAKGKKQKAGKGKRGGKRGSSNPDGPNAKPPKVPVPAPRAVGVMQPGVAEDPKHASGGKEELSLKPEV